MSDPIDLATVEAARFEPLLHEKFSALPWDGPAQPTPLALELARVLPSHLGGSEGQRVPFSLFFDGPSGVSLAQGTYTLTHPQTGEMHLFMVPVARKEGRIQMQAVLS